MIRLQLVQGLLVAVDVILQSEEGFLMMCDMVPTVDGVALTLE
jgi:hypothetical protein